MTIVNTHIHTPYCFSSFESISQTVSMAKKQSISVLGINDFNTTEGYEEFSAACEQYGIYPLFNIEFVSLCREDKEEGFRWNDPANPGIIYLCGKGLNNPPTFSNDSKNLVSSMWKATQDRIWKILERLNELMKKRQIEISLDYNQIRNLYAKNSVREYHIARSLCSSIVQKWPAPDESSAIFKQLFDDPSFEADPANSAFLQDQVHDRLLDTGKEAWVDENHKSVFSIQQIRRLILEGGGIPCYPIFTDNIVGTPGCENRLNIMARKLIGHGVPAVEFLTCQGPVEMLKKYVGFFHQQGFCVTFGTSHNTTQICSLVPTAGPNVPFDSELQQIAYQGACIIAAHQEKRRLNLPGFVDDEGNRNFSGNRLEEFIRIGDEAIRKISGGTLRNC